MLMLILKRFLIAGGIYLVYLISILTGAYLIFVISASFPAVKSVMIPLTYVLGTLCSLVFVLVLKLDNRKFLTAYSEHLLTAQKSFKQDCLFILKSKEHHASLIVLNCIFIPMEISIALNMNIPVLPLVIGTLALIVVQSALFCVLNCLLWMLAFYLKGKRKKKNPSPVGEV